MLPKIEYPVFCLTTPLTKQEVTIRPMTLKDEKILLTAQESKEIVNLMDAMYVCLKNCIVSETDLRKLPWIDIQYIFLFLRSKSIGEISTIMVPDDYEPQKKHKVSVNVEHVDISVSDQDNKIFLTETTGLKMREPLFKHIRYVNKQADTTTKMLAYVRGCVDYIFDQDNVYTEDSFTDEQLTEYLENLPSQTFVKIKDYIDQSPKIQYKISYENSKGERKNITFDTLENFF